MKPILKNVAACWRVLVAAVAFFCAAVPAATAGGKEVVVVYNKRSPGSKAVAEYYADKRAVPADQVIGLDVGTDDSISRVDYQQQIQDPLLKELTGRGLVEFATDIVPARNGHPGRVRYQARASKVRYILLCHGVPFRILPDPGYDPKRDDDICFFVIERPHRIRRIWSGGKRGLIPILSPVDAYAVLLPLLDKILIACRRLQSRQHLNCRLLHRDLC